MLTQQCKFHPVTNERTTALFWPDFMMHVNEGMCRGYDLYAILPMMTCICSWGHCRCSCHMFWTTWYGCERKKVHVDYTDAGPKALSKSKSTTTVYQMSNYSPALAVFVVLLHCVQVAFAIMPSCSVQSTTNRSDTQTTARGCQRLQHCPLVWDGVVHFCTGQTGKYSVHQLSSSKCCCCYYNYNSYCRPSHCIFTCTMTPTHTHCHTHTHTHTHCHTQTVSHTHTVTDTHTYTHTYTHTINNTHIFTSLSIYIYICISHTEQSSWKSVYML